MRAGRIRRDDETLKQAKSIERRWNYYFKMTNLPQTYIVSPRRKLWVELKRPEPVEWLDVEGVVPPGEVGATPYEFGVFYIWDKGVQYYGAQKPFFKEFFLKGRKFTGRWIYRMIPRRKPPGVKGEWLWLFGKPIDQTPYVLTSRAVKEAWIPPYNVSCLPPWIRKQIPKEHRYWLHKSKAKRIEVRNLLVKMLKKKEITLKLAAVVTEVLGST